MVPAHHQQVVRGNLHPGGGQFLGGGPKLLVAGRQLAVGYHEGILRKLGRRHLRDGCLCSEVVPPQQADAVQRPNQDRAAWCLGLAVAHLAAKEAGDAAARQGHQRHLLAELLRQQVRSTQRHLEVREILPVRVTAHQVAFAFLFRVSVGDEKPLTQAHQRGLKGRRVRGEELPLSPDHLPGFHVAHGQKPLAATQLILDGHCYTAFTQQRNADRSGAHGVRLQPGPRPGHHRLRGIEGLSGALGRSTGEAISAEARLAFAEGPLALARPAHRVAPAGQEVAARGTPLGSKGGAHRVVVLHRFQIRRLCLHLFSFRLLERVF
mmetsp:Transcript_71351/g.170452  ORF Transcript_71351/g.170452 Transcript_71351/m.170452 type:complete len:322 (-) Transcript_71351:250-1215(-)